MLKEYKKLIAFVGIVLFLVSCLFSVSFADDDRRHSKYEKKRYSDSYDRRDRDRDSDSDDDYDRDSDSDDDGVTVPVPPVVEPPVVEPPALDGAALYNNNCSMCHGQGKYGNNVPSGHIGSKVNLTQDEINAINSL